MMKLAIAAAFLASCSSSQPLSQRSDDVYYMPSDAPPVAKKQVVPPAAEQRAPATDDYYDEGTAQELGDDRGFYDLAYNDPYYYNYGRFGFGSGPMGWQTGWNGPGWGGGFGMGLGYQQGWFGPSWGMGMGYGWGYGTGVYSGWFRPTFGSGYGFGWGNPYGYGWNPYAWYNDPYYNGYGGFGWGNYWSPYGPCGYYYPVTSSGSTVIGHRGSMSSLGSTYGSDVRQPRMAVRNPVGLQQPAAAHRSVQQRGTMIGTRDPGRGVGSRPGTIGIGRERSPRAEPSRSFDRSPAMRGTSEPRPSIGWGGTDSPSRSGGGGTVPARRGR